MTGMAKVAIKQFINSVADEFGYHAFGGFVGGEVRDTEGMFGLTTGPDYRRGIVGDGRIRWRACWDREGFAPSSRVGGDGLDEAHKVVGGERRVVDGVFRVQNVKQERIQDVTECREIVITWQSNDGLEGSGSDFLGHHGGEGLGARET